MKKIIEGIKGFFEENKSENGYEPAYVGVMLVLVIFSVSLLFWVFWSLMVYKGGLFEKIGPFLSVVFTRKTFGSFGYEGWHEQGIFEGWIVNTVALAFLLIIILRVWSLFRKS